MSKSLSNSNKEQANEDTLMVSEINEKLAAAIEPLNPEQRKIVIKSFQAIQRESFSGPIPHPELLQGYEAVKAGFAERIVRMAEKEQDHRFTCDKMIVKGTVSETSRGQWFALVISVLFLTASVALGFYGHDWLAGILGGGTLVSIVTVFITGRKRKNKEDEN